MSIKETYEQYRGAVAELRTFTESVGGRELTAEENATEARINAAISGLQAKVSTALEAEERSREMADIDRRMAAIASAPTVPAGNESADEAQIRKLFAGEIRELTLKGAERRDLVKGTTTAGGFTVATGFYDQLMEHIIEVSAILSAGATVLRTDNGETLPVPKTTAHGTGALIAEGASITESDPVFGQVNLGAFKYGQMVQVAQELVNDTAVDLIGYIARQAGRAVGNAFGTHAILGTGGGTQPSGIAPNATVGVTGAAAVVGAFSADNLIDLHYSVIAPYRSSTSCAWLMRDASVAAVRKLKDTTNQYLWQPSYQLGQPETLLGKPIFTDPNVAAVGLSARSVLFGDISAYFVRMVNEIRFERSDEFGFGNDLVSFRCILRADGALVDTTGAVKAFVGNAA
ncbi:MAG: phage major capsid protein [Acidimicrobiales bacterium]